MYVCAISVKVNNFFLRFRYTCRGLRYFHIIDVDWISSVSCSCPTYAVYQRFDQWEMRHSLFVAIFSVRVVIKCWVSYPQPPWALKTKGVKEPCARNPLFLCPNELLLKHWNHWVVFLLLASVISVQLILPLKSLLTNMQMCHEGCRGDGGYICIIALVS